MGLDMYLKGKTYNWTDWKKPVGERRPMLDGFEITGIELQLGYWRKHPNLHGYIVNTFAEGKDECQEINLSKENIEEILKAIKANSLPKTSGFFFGESDGTEDQESIEIFQKALEWLEGERIKNESREIIYRASW